jgi:hypothetical protein
LNKKNINFDDGRGSGDVIKFLYYPGIKTGDTRGVFEPEASKRKMSYVSLSAAQDDESARASQHGSYFTRGIWKAIEEAGDTGGGITIGDLKEKSAVFIREEAARNKVDPHTPYLFGNTALAKINIINKPSGKPDNWRELEGLVDGFPVKLDMVSNKNSFRVGDYLILTTKVEQAGYLNIANVDAETGDVIVLFPNRYCPDNYVKADGEIKIPNTDGFDLPAKTTGDVLIVAFLTKEKLNAYKDGIGLFGSLFKSMAPKTYRSIRGAFGVAPGKSGVALAAGKLITEIKD